jgi:hypothetical protein
LLNLDDPPEQTALAFAVGTLIGFSPLLGLHTIIAAVIAAVWRLNKLALFTGVYISNPWTVALVVALSWAIGRLFVDAPPIELPHFAWAALTSEVFWRQVAGQWRQLVPFAIGSCILAVVSSLVSYPLMLYVLRAYRRRYPNRTSAGAAPVSGLHH